MTPEIVNVLMREVRDEISEGATAQSLKQILGQMFERAYEAGVKDGQRRSGSGFQVGHGNTQINSW
jgi:hypothetical protein